LWSLGANLGERRPHFIVPRLEAPDESFWSVERRLEGIGRADSGMRRPLATFADNCRRDQRM
jgi:hypothetical protein